jgi:hypothetical protein
VTTSELVALCESNRSKLDAIAVAGCTTDGLGASSKAECEAARDMCLQSNQGSSSVDCTSASTSDLVGCSATIGEFSACLDTLAKYFNGLSCDNYDVQPPPVPTCFSSLSKECPSLFGP